MFNTKIHLKQTKDIRVNVGSQLYISMLTCSSLPVYVILMMIARAGYNLMYIEARTVASYTYCSVVYNNKAIVEGRHGVLLDWQLWLSAHQVRCRPYLRVGLWICEKSRNVSTNYVDNHNFIWLTLGDFIKRPYDLILTTTIYSYERSAPELYYVTAWPGAHLINTLHRQCKIDEQVILIQFLIQIIYCINNLQSQGDGAIMT